MEATKHPIPKSALLQSIASSYNSEIHRCGASEQWRMQHSTAQCSAVQCSAADRSQRVSNITRDELRVSQRDPHVTCSQHIEMGDANTRTV